jgi:hypothetical protein
MQVSAVGRPKHRATACRHDGDGAASQLVEHRFFEVSETLLPLALEVLPDRTTQALFDHMIGVEEGERKTPGKLPPDGGFSRPREAHQETRWNDAQLMAERPSTRGVMKISNSDLLAIRSRDLNRLPNAGRSPNKGTLFT